MNRIKLTLIEGWKDSWKWLSMQGMAVALAVQGVWITLPDDWRATIPSKLIAVITMVCLIVGVVGRVTKQPFATTVPTEEKKDAP